MAGRKMIPDIMGEVLNSEVKNKVKENSKEVGKETKTPSIEEKNSKGGQEGKVLVTFYLSEDVVNELEDLQTQIRRAVVAKHRGKFNRSLIGQELINLSLESLKGIAKEEFINKLINKLIND